VSKPSGWVKLHRSITEHWIWTSEKHNKQSAWIDLIMMVNHEDRKITVGNKIVIIHRGQVWTSYKKLRERWKWSKDRIKNFIDMLVADKMITVDPTRSGTLITVLNYLIYQGSDGQKGETPGHEPGRKPGHEPGHEPGCEPGTNKNDTRTTKNPKKGTAGTPRKYEA